MSLPKSFKIGYADFFDHVHTPTLLRAKAAQLFDWVARGKLKVKIGDPIRSPELHGRMRTWKVAPPPVDYC
jgi:hypothetical protein